MKIKTIKDYRVLIIGSGAAGYSTADWLSRFGIKKIALLTENVNNGTSRNAGSDKQTYYKLALTGQDSVEKMAQTLFDGGAVDGEIAMIEAANSPRCFMRLVEYGVPFPTDEYGRYAGYQTDHDSTERATSAGPLTSKYMTRCLEQKVTEQGIPVLDTVQVIKIIVQQGRVAGVLALCGEGADGCVCAFQADAVVLATGGQASAYYDTAYPRSQTGAMGLAVQAGCRMCNLTEWQYGIASKEPRWNLSGSYQQVIPRYYSVSTDGVEHDFLQENKGRFQGESICDMIFLKGYQWPFDSKKRNSSSLIDLLVMGEIQNGRRVFLDYRRNLSGYDFDRCSEETQTYLKQAGAVAETPYRRLQALNHEAIALFSSFGVDLSAEPLEIMVAAQHMNGGIQVDTNWQSTVTGLFAVGEAAGTLGVYRPGGTALNSTQVGGLRIAQYLSRNSGGNACKPVSLEGEWVREEAWLQQFKGEKVSFRERLSYFQKEMSHRAGLLRDWNLILKLEQELEEELCQLPQRYQLKEKIDDLKELYKYQDALCFQQLLCKTILASAELVGSRGGSILLKDGTLCPPKPENACDILMTEQNRIFLKKPSPIPPKMESFEKIWQATQN